MQNQINIQVHLSKAVIGQSLSQHCQGHPKFWQLARFFDSWIWNIYKVKVGPPVDTNLTNRYDEWVGGGGGGSFVEWIAIERVDELDQWGASVAGRGRGICGSLLPEGRDGPTDWLAGCGEVQRNHSCTDSLVTGHWSQIELVSGHWSPVTGHWSLITEHWALGWRDSESEKSTRHSTVDTRQLLDARPNAHYCRPPADRELHGLDSRLPTNLVSLSLFLFFSFHFAQYTFSLLFPFRYYSDSSKTCRRDFYILIFLF